MTFTEHMTHRHTQARSGCIHRTYKHNQYLVSSLKATLNRVPCNKRSTSSPWGCPGSLVLLQCVCVGMWIARGGGGTNHGCSGSQEGTWRWGEGSRKWSHYSRKKEKKKKVVKYVCVATLKIHAIRPIAPPGRIFIEAEVNFVG